MIIRRCVPSLNQIGQQEGSVNRRRKQCREKKEEDTFWVNIRHFSNGDQTRINSNYGIRLTTSFSVARDLYVYKIWKRYESKNLVFKGQENRPFCHSHNSNTLQQRLRCLFFYFIFFYWQIWTVKPLYKLEFYLKQTHFRYFIFLDIFY